MPRDPRVHFPGAVYHAYDRGNGGVELFRDWRDYNVFLEYLREVQRDYKFLLHAYCLMPNHFHLLIQVGEVPLSKIMQDLLTRYSKYINRQKQVYGHVFQGRYSAKLVEEHQYFLELVRYIHLNPVGEHLRDRPEHWRWSGHHALIGTVEDPLIYPGRVLSSFSEDAASARRRYAEFVDAGINESVLARSRLLGRVGPLETETGVRHVSDTGSIYR